MIDAVFVENFMRIDSRVDLPLSPVTILVGGNGSGKSSILKAIHWAIRCAALRDHRGNTTLEQMDYAPSRAFQELAHKKRIQNKADLPRIKVGFLDSSGFETTIEISSARNDAGAKTDIDGPLRNILTATESASAYIPGLAGLAEVETVLAAPVLDRRAASGEGGSVLRHILLDLADGSASFDSDFRELSELSDWVSKVIPDTKLWVKFDRIRDVHISALFFTPDLRVPGRSVNIQRRPLEMMGTGYLQIIQIFAYLLKFKPRLLLIDEPDAHLHPGTQELLIRALENASLEFPDTKFIITSHSPHLVRASGPNTRVHWMQDGVCKAEDEDTIRVRMGWGSLDKELLLFTEDANFDRINSILSQWPDLHRKILLWPTFGFSGIPNGKNISYIRDKYKIKILVHRDRDFMSDSDLVEWAKFKDFVAENIPCWSPLGSDVESVFCRRDHISEVLRIDEGVAQSIIDGALRSLNENDVRREFETALQAAIQPIPLDLRSSVGARWNELGGFCQETVKGKVLLRSIKRSASQIMGGTQIARNLNFLPKIIEPYSSIELAPDLKEAIKDALGRNI